MQDPQGKTHTIQVIWANGDAFTIYGLSILGDMPRFGEPLEIIGRADNLPGVQRYEDSTAACFTAGTRTAAGPVAVAVKHPGRAIRCDWPWAAGPRSPWSFGRA